MKLKYLIIIAFGIFFTQCLVAQNPMVKDLKLLVNNDVDCKLIRATHNNGLPFKAKATKQIDIHCEIAPGSDTEITACNSILLHPGFFSEDNFSGSISNCEDTERILIDDNLSIDANQSEGTAVGERTSFGVDENLQIKVYPNPFNTQSTIEYSMSQSALVHADLFDVQGKRVQTLLTQRVQNTGTHQILVNRAGLAAGFYYYRVQIGKKVLSDKLVIID